VKVLIGGGVFWAVSVDFCCFWTSLGQFRSFFRADFPLFVVFQGPRHGILANESRPCTIAHQRIVLRQDVRPQPLSKNSFWEHS
jgi:hypothetical protein